MKRGVKILLLAGAVALLSSCINSFWADEPEEKESQYTRKYVNQFAYNIMAVYYLWVDEIREKLDNWMTNDDPVEKIKEIRYKDSEGKDIDRWTRVTDDYDSFVNSIEGVGTTYGYEFTLYYTSEAREYVAAVVTVIYADSPAAAAGLKRGDVILKVDGSPIPVEGYADIVKSKLMYSSHCELTLSDNQTISMDAVEMYCNPVNVARVFNCGGKKVGYLHYTSFAMNSCQELISLCKSFKTYDVSELILDLRYNSGGYVVIEEVLASMFAPASVVASGDVFMTEVYNKYLTQSWGEEESVTHFRTKFKVGTNTFDTSDVNLGLTKIYAIMTGGSASASEAIICGLKPFVDIEIIGEQSYGKYCTGIVFEGSNWFETYKDELPKKDYQNGLKYAANWGLYVMIGRYADRNGETLCMPNGFIPDHEIHDNPRDGHQLGDPEETMLKAALTLAGYSYPSTPGVKSTTKPVAVEQPAMPKRESFGVFLHQ